MKATNIIRPGRPYAVANASATVSKLELEQARGYIKSCMRERLQGQIVSLIANEIIETPGEYEHTFNLQLVVFTPASLQEFIEQIKGKSPTFRSPFPTLIMEDL